MAQTLTPDDSVAWLGHVDYGPHQRHLRDATAEGPRSAALDCPQFQEWIDRPKQTLHLLGAPGVGKTVTISSIVHDLQSRFSDDQQVGIAFLYCDYRRQGEKRPVKFLLSILKQLVLGQSHVPNNVKQLYNSYKSGGALPGYSEVFRVVSAVACELSRVFIAVDGIEEADMPKNDQERLLRSLSTLQRSSNANILIGGDINTNAIEFSTDLLLFEIRARDEEIYYSFDTHRLQLPDFVLHDTFLQQQIKSMMKEVANGNFLMACLYMNLLSKCTCAEDVQDQLDMDVWRPKGIRDIYEHLIEWIGTQAYEERTVANSILLWLSFTNMPLSVSDLQGILHLQVFGSVTVTDELSAEYLVAACAGLVTVNKQTGMFDFVHPTAREYISQRRLELFPDGESKISSICLKGLVNTVGRVSTQRMNVSEDSDGIHHYFARNWGYHAKRSTIDMTDEIIALLENEHALVQCGQAMISPETYPEYPQSSPFRLSPLHIAAFYGLESTVEVLIQNELAMGKSVYRRITDVITWTDSFLDAQDCFGRTPLSFAAEKGHLKVACTLLGEGGACLDSRDQNDRTPLIFAARAGHVEIAAELVKAGALLNTQDRAGRSPLSWAAANGHEEMIRFLLSHGGILNLSSWTHNSFISRFLLFFRSGPHQDVSDESMTGTPLVRAAGNRQNRVVQALIDMGANPNERSPDCRTGLSWAASNGHESTAQLLINNQANADTVDSNNRTALSWAAGNGQFTIVQLLIQAGSSLEWQDDSGRTAALWAAANGQKGILQLLLDSNADLTSRDKTGMTSFLLAAVNGYQATTEWLLTVPGLSLEDRDSNGRTALSWAVGNGSHRMVKFLLEKGISFHTKDNHGLTVLSWAARQGHREMIQLLFNMGGESLLHEVDNSRRTALHWAAENGHAHALQLFISRDRFGLLPEQDDGGMTALAWTCKNGHQAAAEVILASCNYLILERRNNRGQTPLMLAVSHRHKSIVQLLLECGAVVDARDKSGDTPLAVAIEKYSTSMVELLLSNGADANARLNWSRTPLMLAAEKDSYSEARALFRYGAKANSRDNRGQTALHIAVKNNNSEVVKLLLNQGAAVGMRDNQGSTPMSLGQELGEKGTKVRELLMPKESAELQQSPSQYEIMSGI
ncbi:hypothetical protein N8T08_004743 [Aspergillus melleus]|uniref:Uncharacterized protein n=1 Tax=Aspergillus melleus TaxID=138277 RepID=A0ACC3B486_9EURO|nr:hypothetical protein N8T08_004743 [Aspergillus melleus]